ncbi:MAG: hypothetical protein ABL869_09030 [Candidatus Nitrotoga sp.]
MEELGIRITTACAPKEVNCQSGLCACLSAQHEVRDTLFGPESVIANLIQGHKSGVIRAPASAEQYRVIGIEVEVVVGFEVSPPKTEQPEVGRFFAIA